MFIFSIDDCTCIPIYIYLYIDMYFATCVCVCVHHYKYIKNNYISSLLLGEDSGTVHCGGEMQNWDELFILGGLYWKQIHVSIIYPLFHITYCP